jgi:hypothetical protein
MVAHLHMSPHAFLLGCLLYRQHDPPHIYYNSCWKQNLQFSLLEAHYLLVLFKRHIIRFHLYSQTISSFRGHLLLLDAHIHSVRCKVMKLCNWCLLKVICNMIHHTMHMRLNSLRIYFLLSCHNYFRQNNLRSGCPIFC